jgi:hypothetical protein
MQPRVGAPAQVPRSVQHFLGADSVDDIWVRADPHALLCDIAEDRVQLHAVLAVAYRVDPHQDAVVAQQLFAHCVTSRVAVQHGFANDAELAQRGEHRLEPSMVRVAAGCSLGAPRQTSATRPISMPMVLPVATDRVPHLDRDAEDQRGDGEPDQRVGAGETDREDDRRRDDTEGDEASDARVVPVGDECSAVEHRARAQPYPGRDLVANEPNANGDGEHDEMVE